MGNTQQVIAHINDKGQEQTLKAHLEGTAIQASAFAEEFGCGEAAKLCGLLHDIGKNSQEFQKRIRNPLPSNRVDHSTAGALEVEKINREFIPLGMAIAGHHSGLMDGGNRKTAVAGNGTYFGRLKNAVPDYHMQELEETLKDMWPVRPVFLPAFCKENSFSMSFFIRMLYSCLVDADFLDTEAFMLGQQSQRGGYDSVEVLLEKFKDYVDGNFFKSMDGGKKHPDCSRRMQGNGTAQNGQPVCEMPEEPMDELAQISALESGKINIELYAARNEILRECMEKGEACEPGLYTLTVPTGGGKTIASLGFALRHIVKHSMKRVIYVIPYTSVIDQNAQVFESILGAENIVEHHSGVADEEGDTSEDEMDEAAATMQKSKKALAIENWDAPVIVTTAVQFFESLYGNRSSQCRKLHNLANSVIIFDEAQTLPTAYLKPCVAAIAQLVKNYKATAVLCTATQPALDSVFRGYLPKSFMKEIPEICEKSKKWFGIFRRTNIVNLGEVSKEDMIGRLRQREYKNVYFPECPEKKIEEQLLGEKQVLCIVNRRKLAQELYETVAGEGCYCLTTLLCPIERKRKFREIKDRLQAGKTCRVIATSLVEAGVDLDFPEVYRQEAGLDSLIQSAGRCNREGKRGLQESKVYSFRMAEEENRFLAQNIAALQETWRKYERIDAPEAIAFYFEFFRSLIGKENLDQKEILTDFEKGICGSCFPFATVQKKFRLIENTTRTVLIPLKGTEKLLEQVISGQANRNTFRKLGQFGVNVYENHFRQLWDAGCLEEIGKEVFVLRDMNQYREDIGLQMDVETGYGIFI